MSGAGARARPVKPKKSFVIGKKAESKKKPKARSFAKPAAAKPSPKPAPKPVEEPPVQEEETGFSFIGEEEPAAEAFSFVAEPTEAPEAPEESGFSFFAEEAEAPIEEVPADEENTFAFMSEEPAQEVGSFDTLTVEVATIQGNIKALRERIAHLTEEQDKAMTADNFEEAERVSQQIQSAKEELDDANEKLADTVDGMMEKVMEVAKQLDAQRTSLEEKVPELEAEKERIENEKASLEQQQEEDTKIVAVKREENKEKIEALTRQQSEVEERYSQKCDELTQAIDQAVAPCHQKIEQYQLEQMEVQQRIDALKKELAECEAKSASLTESIEHEEQEAQRIEATFDGQVEELNGIEQEVEDKKQEIALEIAEIEQPYKELLNAINEREQKQKEDEEMVEALTRQLEDIANDSIGVAVSTVDSLVAHYKAYIEERIEVVSSVYEVKNEYIESKKKRDQLYLDLLEINSKLSIAKEFVQSSSIQMTQLEAGKQAAVASKNFRNAQLISKQIKELSAEIGANESVLEQTESIKSTISEELAALEPAIASYQRELTEKNAVTVEKTYNFYEQGVALLSKIMDSSVHASAILAPVHAMFTSLLECAEKPSPVDPEELKARLSELEAKENAAVEAEDYDAAAQVHDEIVYLSKKLGIEVD